MLQLVHSFSAFGRQSFHLRQQSISGNWVPSLICTQPPCARVHGAQWTFLWLTLWAGSLSALQRLAAPGESWLPWSHTLRCTMVSYEDLSRSYGLLSGVDLPLRAGYKVVGAKLRRKKREENKRREKREYRYRNLLKLYSFLFIVNKFSKKRLLGILFTKYQ